MLEGREQGQEEEKPRRTDPAIWLPILTTILLPVAWFFIFFVILD